MTGHANPLHAQHYADRACQRSVEILENRRIARDTYRLRMVCPEIARRSVPGQFVMLRLAGCNDPLIGRPLALYDTVVDSAGVDSAGVDSAGVDSAGVDSAGVDSAGVDFQGDPWGLDVVYLVKGKFTSRLAQSVPGTKLDIWGPLGNGFPPQACDTLIMVAGGIGQTPFAAVGSEALGRRSYGEPFRPVRIVQRAILCYGARSAGYLAGLDDFARLGIDVRVATDDGTSGYHGLVTHLLEKLLDETSGERRIVCCGPEPMMEAVAHIASHAHIPCQVSLETPMACGVGICFTCVARIRDETGASDYRRTCVEGPVFDAALIEW